MTKNLAKWTSEHGQTAKIKPSDGCRRIQLPLGLPCGTIVMDLTVIWGMSDESF